MKILKSFAQIGALVSAVAFTSHCAAQTPPPFTVKIIAFNDFHGNLSSPGTFNSGAAGATAVAAGGADYLAGYIAKLKAQNPRNVVVGAGDFVGATPLVSALFYDEPTIEALNRIGLDFNAVGNHEFDRGAAELLRLQNGGCKITNGVLDPNSCKGASVGTPVPFEGARFRILSANVVATATGRTLLPPYGIKTFNGVRMAFIGMTLRDTPTIVTPSGVAGLEFRDEADTVNALVPRLRGLGVEAIVVLVHQGGFQSGTGSTNINNCAGGLVGSAIASILSRLDNAVDLVVSGHTHTAYNCTLPNASGRLVPVTQASAFGRVLSDIDVTINPTTRDIIAVNAVNRVVDRTDLTVTPSPILQSLVANYQTLVSPIANQVIGSITENIPNTASDNACNMPAGDLIADAQLAATTPAQFGGASIAFMNRGGVRNPGLTLTSSVAGEGDGNVTYGEAFTTQPFGNSLVTMTLTAQDIKNVLEQQFAGCRGQSITATRVLLPSARFRYVWDSTRPCDQRVSGVSLTINGVVDQIVDVNGSVVDPLKPYRVTINSFLATGGDGFTTFNNGLNSLGGAQDIDALVAYMAGFRSPSPPYDPTNPTLAKPRITRANAPAGASCPTGAL